MRMASLIVSILLVVPASGVDPKDLKRGLIVTYTSGQSSVQRLESTIVLNEKRTG